MNLDAGKLRHRITFERFDGTVDTYGDPQTHLDEHWKPVKSVWAAVDPVSGREFYAAQQSQSEVTHKLRCRYTEGIETAMRIRLGTRKFRIISVLDWELRHESLLILAKELVR